MEQSQEELGREMSGGAEKWSRVAEACGDVYELQRGMSLSGVVIV